MRVLIPRAISIIFLGNNEGFKYHCLRVGLYISLLEYTKMFMGKFKTEQGISDCYMEGVLKHTGSISGFIHIVTRLVEKSEGDGQLIVRDVDNALGRLLGELAVAGGLLSVPNDYRNMEQEVFETAERLADPNFFIAEISGVLKALIELKEVCNQKRQRNTNDNG